MNRLKAGDRVEHPGVVVTAAASRGTVEHADASYVRVKWDDGMVGLLYYDEKMIPNARYLMPLKTRHS